MRGPAPDGSQRGARPGRRLGRACALGALGGVLLVTGCSPGYVLRAAYHEAKILWRRQPIERLLAQDDVDSVRRRKLETVLAARRFAEELGLAAGGSFTTLSWVESDQTLFVLSAAPRTALEPYTWWFPIVGQVPYKGFFSHAHAERAAADLEERGFDTHVRGAAAFSTLGWFDDPLLEHALARDELDLVTLVLHELTHNTLYVPGESAFNESFATFVGRRGAIEFFATGSRADPDVRARAEEAWRDERRFSAFVGAVAADLRRAYAGAADEAGALAARAAILTEARAAARASAADSPAFAGFLARPLNNAVLIQYLLYGTDLDVFDRLYAAEGDLRRSVARVVTEVDGADDAPFALLRRATAAEAPT